MMAAGAVFSISGNVSSIMLSGPRMLYAMGNNRVLPQWFGAVHSRFGTPANAIVFIGVLGLLLTLSGSFVLLAAMSTGVRLLVYAVSIAALPRLHRDASDRSEMFGLPGGYAIPLTALLMTCWLITHASAQSWLLTAIFMALGSAFFAATRRSGNRVMSG